MKSLLSWEFIFIFNLFTISVLPLALWALKRRGMTSSSILFLFLHLFPLILINLEFLLRRQGDLVFHLVLCGLHWNLSLLAFQILYWLNESQSPLKLYGALLLSLILSGAFFLLTPPLQIMDPFWGVLPGTISLDPIIHREVYFERLWMLALALIVSFSVGFRWRLRPHHFVFILLTSGLALGVVHTSPLTFASGLKRSFPYQLQDSSEDFTIYAQIEKPAGWPLEVWQDELRFHLQDLRSQLEIWPTEPLHFKIFIYASDSQKARSIGAERTQIGNFARSEMHLSEIEILNPTLRHELVHLIHGKLDLPLISYVDPLYFEGLAVALSTPDAAQSLREARALKDQLESQGRFRLPRAMNFFSQYPGAVAYRLAGALMLENLSHKQWPWMMSRLQLDLSDVHPTEKDRLLADRLLKLKPLFDDPLARDCARLSQDFLKSKDLPAWQIFSKICVSSPLAYAMAYHLPSESREIALRLIAQEIRHPLRALIEADLLVLTDRPNDALALYRSADCQTSTCAYRADLLKLNPASLKNLLLESNEMDSDILRALKAKPDYFELLLNRLPCAQALKEFDDIKRPLTEIEEKRKIELSFYRALQAAERPSQPILRESLKRLEALHQSDGLLARRLRWASETKPPIKDAAQ